MRLEGLIAAVPNGELIRGDKAVEIDSIAYDSRRAEPGCLFICVPGFASDGHEFAEKAVAAGAVALVVERQLELDAAIAQFQVDDARAAMGLLADRFFGSPSAELRVLAITGTNGKTTTCYLVRSILEEAGIRCGLIGTVKQIVGGVEEPVSRTTPESLELHQALRRMLDSGDCACVLEASSHALELARTVGVRFELGAFSNLTQDHLDFHPSMDDYFAAKRILFCGGRGTAAAAKAVVNVDDEWGVRVVAERAALGSVAPALTVSRLGAAAEIRAERVEFDATGSRFRCLGPGIAVDVSVPLIGQFNVDNALMALGVAAALDLDIPAATAALATAEPVPGRMEPIRIGSNQRFAVIVDYAHTPAALRNVLDAARALTQRRLIVVFGCGGDRDRDKRAKMGRVGAELADLVVITSDNPRSEPPEAIIAEILAGTGSAEPIVEPDRRVAIAVALTRADAGDLVVIAGKGHEQGQEFADGETVPFDDRVVARQELERLLGAVRR